MKQNLEQLDSRIDTLRQQLRQIKKMSMASDNFLHNGEGAVMKWIYKYNQTQGGKPNMLAICNILNITQATMTPLVSRLEEKGYVKREVSQQDRRAKLLALTAEGEKILLAKHKKQHEAFTKIVTQLGRKDTEELIRILTRINKFIGD